MQEDSSSVATEELMHCAWLGLFPFSFFATSNTTQFVLQLQLPLTTLSPAPQAENVQAPLIAEVLFPPTHLPWFAQNLLSFNSSSFSKLRMMMMAIRKPITTIIFNSRNLSSNLINQVPLFWSLQQSLKT
jgi:hypothetical protein